MGTEPIENQSGERRASFLSSLSAADKRLALMTFAATLAANLATVVLVALAILAARVANLFDAFNNSITQHHHPLPVWVAWMVLALMFVGLSLSFNKRVRESLLGISVALLLGVLGILMCIFWLFATLGALVSVK